MCIRDSVCTARPEKFTLPKTKKLENYNFLTFVSSNPLFSIVPQMFIFFDHKQNRKNIKPINSKFQQFSELSNLTRRISVVS